MAGGSAGPASPCCCRGSQSETLRQSLERTTEFKPNLDELWFQDLIVKASEPGNIRVDELISESHANAWDFCGARTSALPLADTGPRRFTR